MGDCIVLWVIIFCSSRAYTFLPLVVVKVVFYGRQAKVSNRTSVLGVLGTLIRDRDPEVFLDAGGPTPHVLYCVEMSKAVCFILYTSPNMIPRAIFSRALRQSAVRKRAIQTLTRPSYLPSSTRCASHVPHQTARWISSKSLADEKIEEITELYATAQDEFEIAM